MEQQTKFHLMSSLAPYRITYLRLRYFDQMPADTLHTKIAKDAAVRVTNKTVENWLAGKPSKINPVHAAEPAAALFATRHTKDPERTKFVKAGLTNFILKGTPSPFVILSGHEMEFGLHLTMEHMLPFIDDERAKELSSGPKAFADLGDVNQLQAGHAFLRGDTPNDWAMVGAVAIERPEESDLLKAAKISQFVVLTSAAGDGKSTLLRRLALKLKREGQEVHFFVAPPIRSAFPEVPTFDVPTYVLIDSAHLASSYHRLTEAIRRDANLHVILAARHYEWTRRRFDFSDLRPTPVHLERIDRGQAHLIAHKIIAYGAAPAKYINETALVDRMLCSVRSDRFPHLLAAMMSATRGKDFEGIIDDMIRAFEDGGDAAALRYVALGALTCEISGGKMEPLPHYIFHRLLAEMVGVSPESGEGRERIRAMQDAYSSELLSIRSGGNSNLTVYDLRHPDITHRIVERYYGGRWGKEISRLDDLKSDFADICRADASFAHQTDQNLEIRYTPRFAFSWLRSAREHEWLTADAATLMIRSVCDSFDNTERGKIAKSAILKTWAAFESNKPYTEEREQLIDALFTEAVVCAPGAASIWAQWAAHKAIQDEQGARHIFEKAWMAGNREPHLFYSWAAFEWLKENIGGRNAPADFSARGLFQHGWSGGKKNLEYVRSWARLERQEEIAGKEIETGPFSARGIIQDAWTDGLRHILLVDEWATIEAASENIGDPKKPIFPSARWLLRNGTSWSSANDHPANDESFDKRALKNADHVKLWARLEIDEGFVGEWPTDERDEANPEQFTARWILREAWNPPISNSEIVGIWCSLEQERGKPGDIENPGRYSVRWLYRESLRRFSSLPLTTYQQWLSFELRNKHIRGEAGTYPAALIFEKICTIGISLKEQTYWEARMADAEGKLGDFENPAHDSARHYYRTLFREYRHLSAWFAKMELEAPDHDHYAGKEWSAEWLFAQYRATGGRLDTLGAWLGMKRLETTDGLV